MAEVREVPYLSCLTGLETVYIRQMKVRIEEKDYSVFTDTKDLFHLRELERELSPVVYGARPWWFLFGLDQESRQQAFEICRSGLALGEKYELFIGGLLVNVVRQKTTFKKPVILITDSLDELELRLKGQSTDKINYQLQTKDKVTIGSVFKVTYKSPEELLPHLDDYIINFPAEMDLRLKVAVIVACVVIDLA